MGAVDGGLDESSHPERLRDLVKCGCHCSQIALSRPTASERAPRQRPRGGRPAWSLFDEEVGEFSGFGSLR